MFRATWEGGFVTPESLLARLPIVVVYADGRVITQGPQIDIYPGPLMPNLQEQQTVWLRPPGVPPDGWMQGTIVGIRKALFRPRQVRQCSQFTAQVRSCIFRQ